MRSGTQTSDLVTDIYRWNGDSKCPFKNLLGESQFRVKRQLLEECTKLNFFLSKKILFKIESYQELQGEG